MTLTYDAAGRIAIGAVALRLNASNNVEVATIVLYTTPYCPYCIMAKRLFDQKGVAYENIDVSGDHEKRRWLVETTGQRTVPQIFIDGTSYGGFTDVSAIDREGRLDALIGI